MTATTDRSLARSLASVGLRPLPRPDEAAHGAGSPPGAPWPCDGEDGAGGWIRLAPGFDWLRLLRERDDQLRGAGGHIRQSALCLDPLGAADCCRFLGRWPASSALRTALPLYALARCISRELGPRPLQVVVLGVKEGSTAARLGQELLWVTGEATVQLCLCDPSVPLLCAALRDAAAVLPGSARLRLDAVAGPPDSLSDLLATGPPPLVRDEPARLFTLLGCALADLDDEARFLRYGLAGAAPGDLLLIDTEVAAPRRQLGDQTAAVEAPPPAPVPTQLPKQLFDWLEGLVRRARRDVVDIGWHTEPEPHRALPASHTLRVVATVRCRDRDRRFVLHQLKRYDPEPLADFIERWGWKRLLQQPYGPEQRGHVQIFRRLSDGERSLTGQS